MAQTFFFVDGRKADRASKRQMRSHVMKGKNAGRTIHRPSKLKPKDLRRPVKTVDAIGFTDPRVVKDGEKPSSLAKFEAEYKVPRNSFLFYWLPVKISAEAGQTISDFFNHAVDRIYPAQLGLSLDEAKLMWLPTMFADEAASVCNIHMMEACNEIFLRGGDGSANAAYHLSRTFAQVKKRLDSDVALSDSTISIVLSLISQEQIRGQHSAAKVHAKGLKKIVELRGGLSSLESNIGLVLKTCKIDIVLSLQYGEPTTFYRDRMEQVRDLLANDGLSLQPVPSSPLIGLHKIDPAVRSVLDDVLSACALFNSLDDPDPNIDLATYQEILVSILYRLLKFRSVDSRQHGGEVEESLHIGLTLFMMTIFLRLDNRRIMDFGLMSGRSVDILDNDNGNLQNGFTLWLMMIGGIWSAGSSSVDEIGPKMRIIADRLELTTWQDVKKAIERYPWVDSIHEEPGKAFWRQSHSDDVS